MNIQSRIRASLQAFACGDALGMPTEFMPREAIKKQFGRVTALIPAEQSANHSDLPMGSITDDTEQVLWLLSAYRKDGDVTVENTTAALLSWIRETDAVAKKYIGPSSKRALEAVEAGEDPHTTGIFGTTCGGIMRVASVVYFDPEASEELLFSRVVNCLMPTHYTWEALEAAGAYAFALQAALQGKDRSEILDRAERGGALGRQAAPWQASAPSSMERVRFLQTLPLLKDGDEEALLDFLFTVYGTGLPSADCFAAAFGIWLAADGSAHKAISLGASLGGDTDTIAALAGALTAAEAGKADIPQEIWDTVRTINAPCRGDLWSHAASKEVTP